jgi:hypothetical protein
MSRSSSWKVELPGKTGESFGQLAGFPGNVLNGKLEAAQQLGPSRELTFFVAELVQPGDGRVFDPQDEGPVFQERPIFLDHPHHQQALLLVVASLLW